MSTTAIIPARGGSKGIPHKNIKLLAGKPLVAWAIEAAKAVPGIDRVIVSTDDGDIEMVSLSYGAEVVRRPDALATDSASSESALLHVLDQLRELEDYVPEVTVFLQCTSPLIKPEDIEGTMALVTSGQFDSAVTMTPFHHFIWKDDGDQMVGVNHIATRRLMRQEREPEFLEVGAVYAMRTSEFVRNRFRFFGRIGRYPLAASRALEIDDPDDWVIAERALADGQYAIPSSGKLRKIKMVVTDFDGVMTDNRVFTDENGIEAVICSRGDGWGIGIMRQLGLLVACISTEENPVVTARCRKLQIPCYQGQRDKLAMLDTIIQENGLTPEQCLYIGNDTNDLSCLQHAGIGVVPKDAEQEVVARADWQTATPGGFGVLREVARGLATAKSDMKELS